MKKFDLNKEALKYFMWGKEWLEQNLEYNEGAELSDSSTVMQIEQHITDREVQMLVDALRLHREVAKCESVISCGVRCLKITYK